MSLPGRDRSPEIVAEEIMENAEQDISTHDLTRGTEVYEYSEDDEELEDSDDDSYGIEELDFEPRDRSQSIDDFNPEDDYGSNEDDY